MSRILEREMAEFGTLLFGHLARFHELVVERTLHRGTAFRVEVAATAIALCWRDRAMFQPPEESVLRWLDDHLVEAVGLVRKGGLAFSDEELALLRFLQKDGYDPPAHLYTTTPHRYYRALKAQGGRDEGAQEPPSLASVDLHVRHRVAALHAEDCLPCWRCRWFDGWLPKGPVIPKVYADPEITEACAAIDRRKVEIAKRIRAEAE